MSVCLGNSDIGPRPEAMVPKISVPLLLLWGEKDPWTPANGPVSFTNHSSFIQLGFFILFFIFSPKRRFRVCSHLHAHTYFHQKIRRWSSTNSFGGLSCAEKKFLIFVLCILQTDSKLFQKSCSRTWQPCCEDTPRCRSLPSRRQTRACSGRNSSVSGDLRFMMW
jgi:hypothetical protein